MRNSYEKMNVLLFLGGTEISLEILKVLNHGASRVVLR